MLKNFFGGAAKPARTAQGERIYAIGDIHGCADLLDSLLGKIAADSGGTPFRLVFLGDYIDRGPDSRGVLDRLCALKTKGAEASFLKGNHEDVFLDFMRHPAENADWLDWGGAEMVASYGVKGADEMGAAALAASMRARMPAAHLDFLQSLATTARSGDYLFVHAGVRPGVALADQREQDLLWIRGEFHNAPEDKRPDAVVVHGHHPMKKPLDAGWRIAVDTGACFTGRLTAVVLDGETRRFLST